MPAPHLHHCKLFCVGTFCIGLHTGIRLPAHTSSNRGWEVTTGVHASRAACRAMGSPRELAGRDKGAVVGFRLPIAAL